MEVDLVDADTGAEMQGIYLSRSEESTGEDVFHSRRLAPSSWEVRVGLPVHEDVLAVDHHSLPVPASSTGSGIDTPGRGIIRTSFPVATLSSAMVLPSPLATNRS